VISNSSSSSSRRSLALYFLCIGVLMIVLDATIVAVALPTILVDMRLSTRSLVWMLNSYTISFGGFLLLSGRLGDLYGQRRLFLGGIIAFTVASLACGVTQTEAALLTARVVQGLAGATVTAVSLPLILALFPEPAERAQALGIYGFICASGGSVGLVVGGLVTSALNWHWIFLINLPVGVAVYVVCAALLPQDESTQSRVSQSLLPVGLFKVRNFALANALGVLWSGSTSAWFALTTVYLQYVLRYNPLQVGIAFTPETVLVAVLSGGVSAKLVTRLGVRAPLCCGLVLASGGLALFARVPIQASFALDVLPGMILIGLGAGLISAPLLLAATNQVDQGQAGAASGMLNTAFLAGGTLGLAALVNLATGRTEALQRAGHATAEALISGYRLAFLVSGLLALAAAALGTLIRSTADARPAQQSAASSPPGSVESADRSDYPEPIRPRSPPSPQEARGSSHPLSPVREETG
jgi:MFS family permease